MVAGYPSHLHVDLLPDRQGEGWGRRLLETLFDALAATGSPGVHLGVAGANTQAIGFYRRMGFVELKREHGGLTLGRRLDACVRCGRASRPVRLRGGPAVRW